jgi:hypothetical protein
VDYEHLPILGVFMVVGWFLYLYFWPRVVLYVLKRALLGKGFGDGRIAINTLHTEPQALFADPLHPPAAASSLATTGVNRDTLITAGWLDLSRGPQILRVPDMAGRYYSVQFTDGQTHHRDRCRRLSDCRPPLEGSCAAGNDTDLFAE